MDDENQRALEALRTSAPVAVFAPVRRSMAVCPHCHEGFGSASLPIHVRRCRALLPPPESEVEVAAPPPAPVPARRPLPLLVDLCLRFINKHFESLYLDRVTEFPEAEGALIASMPPNLVHRLIINLVNSSKKLKVKGHAHRATTQKLKSALDEAQRECEQLAAARRAEAVARSRLGACEQAADQMRRELEIATKERSSADARNRDLLAQLDALTKQQTRLEAKIQSLASERDVLKENVKAAQKREMEATKQLALASREKCARTPAGRRGTEAKQRSSTARQGRVSLTSGGGNQSRRRNDSGPPRDARAQDQQVLFLLRKRPRSAASKIPLPRLLPDEYRRKLESEVEPVVAAPLA